jgi:hypothetical protein
MSHHQNVGKNYYIKIDNRTFENIVKFKYFGKALYSKLDP